VGEGTKEGGKKEMSEKVIEKEENKQEEKANVDGKKYDDLNEYDWMFHEYQ